jgi:UDP-N-acetylglucosamine 4,6-dehydratase
MGSRGSVLPVFQRLAASGKIPITDDRMTRFWITLPQAIQFVVDAFDRMFGGEIFVPRIPSATILDLAKAIAPDATLEIIGIRPGEKLHEEMISENDSRRTYEFDDHYVIAPMLESWLTSPTFTEGKLVHEDFSYRSNTNDQWLDVAQIRELAKRFS